ncbi:uncharacterized protein [Macrobrachium rosenbergii]|uniref:uncharacterized protein n=1 Tax=Macrobrachium rosenbergii TaxID=79674 RepID=UPI0034D71568
MTDVENGILWPVNTDGTFDESFLELLKLEKGELAFILWKLTKKIILAEEKLCQLRTAQPDLCSSRNALLQMLISGDSLEGESGSSVSSSSSMSTLIYVDECAREPNGETNEEESNAVREEYYNGNLKTLPEEILSTDPEKCHISEPFRNLGTFPSKEERPCPGMNELKANSSKNQTQYRKNRQKRKRRKNKKKKARATAPKQQQPSTGGRR